MFEIEEVERDLSADLIESKNPDEIKDIISIFNTNLKKKDIIRANTLSNLQDKITQEMADRIEHNSAEFSNKDLLDYMNTLQNIVSKSSASYEDVQIPQIAIQNNTTVNIENATLDRESKNRVKEALKAILEKGTTNG